MAERLLVIVRTGAPRRRLRAILRWVRALIPAASLAVAAPGAPPRPPDGADVLVLDVDEAAGPLSIAEGLLRARRDERRGRGGPV